MALIVVDTTVLVALLDRSDALHEHARTVLEKARDDDQALLVPSIAYAETMVRPLERGAVWLTLRREHS